MKHIVFITRVAVILLCVHWGTADAALVEWTVVSGENGHFYGITDSASDWASAEATAISLGGHLATITSSSEQAFVETTFLNGSFEHLPLWIGLTDEVSEGTQVWVTGEPLGFSNWKSGEPNNDLGDEDYITINWDFSRNQGFKGTWNDTPLNGTTGWGGNTTGPYHGLVEVVPEPASSLLLLGGMLFCGATLFACRRKQEAGK